MSTRVAEGDAKKVIVEEAKHWNADFIVLGHHNGLLHDSVTSFVIHHAPCTVVIAKEKQK